MPCCWAGSFRRLQRVVPSRTSASPKLSDAEALAPRSDRVAPSRKRFSLSVRWRTDWVWLAHGLSASVSLEVVADGRWTCRWRSGLNKEAETGFSTPSQRSEYRQILDATSSASFGLKQVLLTPGKAIDTVYFPRGAVISLLTTMDDGSSIEIATIGNEGFVGVPVFWGPGMGARDFYQVQVPGEAVAMEAKAFLAAARRGRLHDLVQRYTQALFTQVTQQVACNGLHSVEERCSRWMLLTHDRVGSDSFPLTQEFLAQMLGVRRASVTVAAGALQHAGFIRYNRGRSDHHQPGGSRRGLLRVLPRNAHRVRPALPAAPAAARCRSADTAWECPRPAGSTTVRSRLPVELGRGRGSLDRRHRRQPWAVSRRQGLLAGWARLVRTGRAQP